MNTERFGLSALIFFLLFSLSPAFAIVNTEATIQSFNKQGINASLGFDYAGRSGNASSNRFGLDFAAGWVGEQDRLIGILSRDYGEFNDTKNVDSHMVYGKYLRSLSTKGFLSLFAQKEQDQIKNIDSRRLIGVGYRYEFSEKNIVELSYMEERIDSIAADEPPRETDRFNLMWHANYQLEKTMTFKNTLYYQPAVNDFSNAQAINSAQLKISVNDHFSVTLYHKLTHLSDSLQGTESTDSRYGTALRYTF